MVVDRDTATLVDTTPQNEQPRRNRNRVARSETDAVAGDQPARRNAARQTNPRPAAADPTGEIDCDNFTTHAEAQAYSDDRGWSAKNDPYRLDQGGVLRMP